MYIFIPSNQILLVRYSARGFSCRVRGDLRLEALANLYCIICDPNQPRVCPWDSLRAPSIVWFIDIYTRMLPLNNEFN